MTLHELQRRLKGFNILTELADSVDETKEAVVELNREQLLHGLDSEGNYLSPTYLEDPFFKSPESGKRYAEWKARIEPKRDKPFFVPNLFITGRYHSTIDLSVTQETMVTTSDDPAADSIEAKFGEDIYGLNSESKSEYIPNHLLPILQTKITGKLGLKFG